MSDTIPRQAVRDYLKGNTMTEYGRKHTDGSRSGGQPVTNDKDSAVLLHCPNCEATKQHEDFKQRVSFALKTFKDGNMHTMHDYLLDPFIIPAPKPDPLVEVLAEVDIGNGWDDEEDYARQIHKALEARGLEIKEKSK